MTVPVDWAARFRAAAEAARRSGQRGVGDRFDDIADIVASQRGHASEAVEAIGQALLGEDRRPV